MSSSGSSPLKPTRSNLQAHDSSLSEDSTSPFHSAASGSLSSASSSSRGWPAGTGNADPSHAGSLDWFEPGGDYDTDSAVSAVSAASSSQQDDTSGDSQRAAAGSGLAILLVQGLPGGTQQGDDDGAPAIAVMYRAPVGGAAHAVSLDGTLVQFQLEVRARALSRCHHSGVGSMCSKSPALSLAFHMQRS